MASREFDRPRMMGGTRKAVVEKQFAKLRAEGREEERAQDAKLRLLEARGPWWRKPSDSSAA